MQTNLIDFYQALASNFKGLNNKIYISESLHWHFREVYITKEEYLKLGKESL